MRWLPCAARTTLTLPPPPHPPHPTPTAARSFSPEAKNLISRLLTADRSKRLGCLRGGASDVKEHPWFAAGSKGGRMDWDRVYRGEAPPPYVPRVRNAADTSNFDRYPDSDGETAHELSGAENALFVELEAL